MTIQIKSSVALFAFALTACGYTTDFRDNSNFGFATTQNLLVQSAYGGNSGLQDLNGRFSADVPTTVNFEFNRSELDGAAMAALDRQAQFINGFPMIRFRVYGHTDKVGSENFNQGLGLRRAQAVVSYLVSRGVSRSRVEAVVSEGESQPIVNTEGRERLNRRAVTQVAGFARGFNGADFDGKRAALVYAAYVDDKAAEVEANQSVSPTQ